MATRSGLGLGWMPLPLAPELEEKSMEEESGAGSNAASEEEDDEERDCECDSGLENELVEERDSAMVMNTVTEKGRERVSEREKEPHQGFDNHHRHHPKAKDEQRYRQTQRK